MTDNDTLPWDQTGLSWADDRALRLRGAPNARDLGGIRTVDGRMLRRRRLLRADALGWLTDADLRVLAGHHLSAVIDLRHPAEVALARPDRLPPGQRVVQLPVYDPEHPVFLYLAAVLLGQQDLAAFGEVAAAGTPGAMLAVYRWFVADPAARMMFAAAVREIAATPGPVLFHCSAGKDRTGWLAAILLDVLGVDRDTIVADYLLTNAFTESLVAPLRSRPGFDMAVALPVLQARREYLDAAYAEVDLRYGSLDAYLRDGLGLDGAVLDAVRASMLV